MRRPIIVDRSPWEIAMEIRLSHNNKILDYELIKTKITTEKRNLNEILSDERLEMTEN